jgi:hypothetical protein|tara:strand:- start:54322 stop:55440 length:1119 start_codon:yes stop_codon:yes gene_type:complete
MSEYQYYEFQAIDRPLTKAEREMLRGLSTRGRITATSFTNEYEWGDFKGDPKRLMESCFDLHLYFANWGTRRLMIRLPSRLLDQNGLGVFLDEVDWVTVWNKGDHTIIDIYRDPDDSDEYWEYDEDSPQLGALAPLRGDIVSGDMRLFYLLWLCAVTGDLIANDAPEPLPGIGPLTGTLQAAAELFGIDRDLMEAAAAAPYEKALAPDVLRAFIVGLDHDEKTSLLTRVMEGDTHIASQLRQRVRTQNLSAERPRRTVGELRARAREIRKKRKRAEVERRRAEYRRKAEEAEIARRARLDAVRRRGASVWKEIEAEIERRNTSGYDRAAVLLADLKQLAVEGGAATDFSRRLTAIRERHVRKGQFIKRLQAL